MSIHRRRLLLLSSSALVLFCWAGVASSQTTETPQETPPATTTTPETPATPTPAPEMPAPQPSPPAPETPQAEPGTAPALPIPQVTVQAPKPRPARRTAPAAPARTTAPSPPPSAPPTTTPPTTPTATTAGQPAAPSPFQPPPSRNTLNSAQIQASESKSLGGLFFTMPGATSAGLAPGTQRPVLRGLDDFRVRVQENGVGSMDVSDLGQDHGVPLDPLAIQQVQIYRGPEALRYGSQAVGGVVEATNNRIPFAAPLGGWQTQVLSATTTIDRGAEGGALFDGGSRDFAFHADVYGRRSNDYFIPSYPYLFPSDPAPPFNGKQPNSSFHSEGQAVGGSYLFDGGYVGAAVSRFSTLYHIPTMEGAATNGRIALEQVKYTSRGEFRPQSSAIDVVRFWAGAVEYHHDELGVGDDGIDGIRATFNNHAQEARSEIQVMPMATPLGTLISTVGGQFDHQQIDTSGDAGSLLGQARTNRGAGYVLNELWFTDTLRMLSAGRVETVRLDGTAGIFPPALVPPPDNPTLSLQSLGFTPASVSFKVLKDLPSWMVASATVQRIQRAPTALELFAHGAHDSTGTFDIGDPTLKKETAHTAELGLLRFQGDFRFDAKIYYTYYNNFSDRHPLRRELRHLRQRHRYRVHPDHLFPARRDLPRHRSRLAVGSGAGGDLHFRRRRPIRLRAGDLRRRRRQRPAHAAHARRRRRLLARRELVRAHGPAARLRAARPRRERHAHRRLQPAQDGNHQQAILARFAVGTDRGHYRPHRRQPARRRRAQLRAIPQG